jgi:hypothetical protein
MDKINTGTALVTGIQDISAFLAIIGTEQCERHVGAALQGGFLYAAATPMSLFGSVGVIKVSASILVASISPFWATILTDAGFSIEGAVAGVIAATPRTQRNASKYSVPWFRHWPWLARLRRAHTMKNNQEQHITIPPYIAAQKFKELLEKQHIVEPQLALQFNYSRWNGWLCIWTGLLSGLNIIPYIPFILDDRPPSKPIPAWAFPLTRIVGSAVAVVVCQMIIQIQMERILRSTAQWVMHLSESAKTDTSI